MKRLLWLLAFTLLGVAAPASAAVSRLVTVQGQVLTGAGTPANGSYDLTFRLFAASSGGAALFTQAKAGVSVAGGVFDTELGPVPDAVLTGNAELWLEVQVGTEAPLPRRPLRAAPWAIYADLAGQAADLACSGCVGSAEVDFPWAKAASKGGAPDDLACSGCVSATEIAAGAIAAVHLQAGVVDDTKVAFNYAGSTSKGGPATDLGCTGCVGSTDLASGLALKGNVSVEGSLSACTANQAGCAVAVSESKLVDANDGWLTVGAPNGVRVRNAALSAAAPLDFGAGAAHGGLTVDGGDLTVAGKVGVGTAAPATTLQVNGTWALGANGALPGFGTGGVLRSGGGNLVEGGGSAWATHLVATGGGDIARFGTSTGPGATPDTKVVITNAGKVGIGTATPSATLEVGGAGDISAKTLKLGPSSAETLAAAQLAQLVGGGETTLHSHPAGQGGGGGTVGPAKAKGWTVWGSYDACHDASGATYTTVPEMTTTVTLTETSVVLTEFDINVVGCSTCWVAFRLRVNGSPDTKWTHIQPEGGGDEDDSVHLFRLDELPPGTHTISAEWGDGSGTMCNYLVSGALWTRRLSVLAVPQSLKPVWGYANPTDSQCKAAGGYTDIPGLSLPFTLPETSVVLSQFDINWVGCNGCWMGARMVVDGAADVRWTHTQPQGGGDEDDHVHLHRIDTLPGGTHNVKVEWGDGSGTMCNHPGSAGYWTRRVGFLAVPVSQGARGFYKNAATTQCKGATPYGYSPVPDMVMDFDGGSTWTVGLTHFDINWVGCNGCWMGTRLAVDGRVDPHWIHTQPEGGGDEDDHVHLHRIDTLPPGMHNVMAQWGEGSGTMCNNASSTIWTRRIGVFLLPAFQ